MSKNPFQNFVVRVNAGQPIFKEGDSGSTMYIVQKGDVQLCRTVENEQRDLGVMEKGDFFGEMSVLEGLPRTHSAVALSDVELIEINGSTFDKMIRSNIEIAVRMLRKLSIRLRAAERKLDERLLAQEGGTLADPTVVTPAISGAPPTIDLEPAVAAAAAEAGIRLEAEGMQFPVSGAETLVGRYDPVTEVRPDIDLTDVDMKRSVSRRHARIINGSEGFAVIEEVGALNGTFVNGQALTPGEPHPLTVGDEVSFGLVKMVLLA